MVKTRSETARKQRKKPPGKSKDKELRIYHIHPSLQIITEAVLLLPSDKKTK